MATVGGIPRRDWDKVHDLALLIVGASVSRRPARLKRLKAQMLKYLSSLENRYGELPSILATRADYLDDARTKEELLIRAYGLSKRRRDSLNQLEIAHSLSQLYIERFRAPRKATIWLRRLKAHLEKSGSPYQKNEYHFLKQSLRKLLVGNSPGKLEEIGDRKKRAGGKGLS